MQIGRNTIDFARTAALPCVRKHGDTLRASTKKDVHWIIAHLFYQVSGAFEKTKRTLLDENEFEESTTRQSRTFLEKTSK